MGIFSRFMDIVNANINSILDKAEDPEKMLRLMIQEMEDTLIELKSNAAGSIAQKIKTERKKTETEATIERWQQRAILAIEKGKEDLAREALLEKKKLTEELSLIESQLEENARTIDSAKSEIETLEEKLTQAKAKLKIIKEKEERARAEEKAESLKRKNMSEHFAHMEEKIDRMNAWRDINSMESSDTEKKFSDLERDEDIEKELDELKKKAGRE